MKPTTLQGHLLPQIIALIRDDGLAEGAPLKEVELANRLKVSRTPIRSALAHLALRGIVRSGGRGYVVGDLSAPEAVEQASLLTTAPTTDEHQRLSLQIANDHVGGKFDMEVFETDLMRRYQVGRPLLQQVLTELAGLGVIERRQGRGWVFQPAIADPEARMDSFRWRIMVEPAMLLEPAFSLEPGWTEHMRARHLQMLNEAWKSTKSVAFFELNADFHEGLARASKNRFVFQAIKQQNQLRRLHNYSWAFSVSRERVTERVKLNAQQHLDMIDRLEKSEFEVASALMKQHLLMAADTRQPGDWDLVRS